MRRFPRVRTSHLSLLVDLTLLGGRVIHVMSRFQVNRLGKDIHYAMQESGYQKGVAVNRFMIDNNDKISLVSGETIPEGGQQFHSARQFENLSKDWPSARFVQIWNQLPGMRPVKKFTDRKIGITRIWNAIESLYPQNVEPRTRSPRSHTGAVREHTKTARVIALLKQPGGCSLREPHESHRLAGAQCPGVPERPIA